VSKQRLEAFSDGVFAIAATLLVLDLHVPDVKDGRLVAALLAQWPAYAAYVTAFLTILIIWVNHHHLLARARRVDPPLLLLNGLLLMSVAVLPFPTGLFAHYLELGHDANVAGAVFALSSTLMAVTFTAVFVYLEGTRPKLGWGDVALSSAGLAIYPLAGLVSLIWPMAALAIFAATATFYAILPLVRRGPPEPA
jgi:uncharacterized membrane protein